MDITCCNANLTFLPPSGRFPGSQGGVEPLAMMSFSSHGGHDVAVLIGAPEPSQTSLAQGQISLHRAACSSGLHGCMAGAGVEQPRARHPGTHCRLPDDDAAMQAGHPTHVASHSPFPAPRVVPSTQNHPPPPSCVRACARMDERTMPAGCATRRSTWKWHGAASRIFLSRREDDRTKQHTKSESKYRDCERPWSVPPRALRSAASLPSPPRFVLRDIPNTRRLPISHRISPQRVRSDRRPCSPAEPPLFHNHLEQHALECADSAATAFVRLPAPRNVTCIFPAPRGRESCFVD
ncbi:hypothetical protein PCL_09681 [Purpureocillium lilacinum]|uniref:Uncharacterized protein n=1 Tax=Purpureocillium lilacinum TaxID=33203 RepID=A0A2U3EDS9_PURLI|nr:hypothetical protein PCL_09681 [Purpureocillium lilacinum]